MINRSFYVDYLSGDDGNLGLSAEKPWKSFENINRMILTAGDSILLKRGCVWNEQLTINGKGNAGNFLNIGSYGVGDRPKIQRSGDIADRCMRINNPSFVKVSGLEICNGGAGIVVFWDCDYENRGLYFDDICGHDFGGIYISSGKYSSNKAWRDYTSPDRCGFSFAISLTGNDDSASYDTRVCTDIRFTNCEIYHTGAGIGLDWGNGKSTDGMVNIGPNKFGEVLFEGIHFHDQDAADISLTSMYAAHVTGCVIRNCIFDKPCAYAPNGTAAIHCFLCKDVMVEGCTIMNIPAGDGVRIANDCCGIDFETSVENVTIQNCLFINNVGAGVQFLANAMMPPVPSALTRNVEIRYCTFIDNMITNINIQNIYPQPGQIYVMQWEQRHERVPFTVNRPTGSIHHCGFYSSSGRAPVDGDGDLSGLSIFDNRVLSCEEAPSYQPEKGRHTVIDLKAWCNRDAFSRVENRGDCNFGEASYGFPSNLLKREYRYNDVYFRLGPFEDGALNCISCNGQTIEFEKYQQGTYSYIAMVCASSVRERGYEPGVFGINYIDSSHSEIKLSVKRWLGSENGQNVIASVNHIHAPGIPGPEWLNAPTGSDEYRKANMYVYYLRPLQGKQLAGISLPYNPNINILAITLISFGACDNSIPARSWEFDNNGNTEGWQVEAGISNPDPAAAATGELQVLDGCLNGMMAGDKVTVIISSDCQGIDITRAQNISILLKTSIYCTTGAVQFITEADPIWNSEKTYKFVLNPNAGRYSGYLLDMSSMQGWTGRLKQLKIIFANGNGAGNFSIEHIRVVDESGEVSTAVPSREDEISLSKTAFASSRKTEYRHNECNAIDGSSWSFWSSEEKSGNHWYKVDLGSVCRVNRVIILWKDRFYEAYPQDKAYAVDYHIEVSVNDKNYIVATSRAGNTEAETEDSFNEIEARYVRLVMTKGVKPDPVCYAIRNFRVFGTEPIH